MRIAFNIKLMRPGGPYIQLMHGGSVKAALRFPEHLWLTKSSADLKLYTLKDDEFEELLRMTLTAAATPAATAPRSS